MNNLKTTNTLLLFIVIPVIFYILKILSFIFIPLVLSMIIALLFLPLMRWMSYKHIPKPIGVLIVMIIIGISLKIGGELIQLSSNEILSADSFFFNKAEAKLVNLVQQIERFFGVERIKDEDILVHYLKGKDFSQYFGSTIEFIGSALSMTLTTIFFVVLFLLESINFENILNSAVFKSKYSSVKTFIKIENDIIKFVKVKFIISLFTGIGFSLSCLFFGISFPIFWGLFAFLINFVQMIGSIISIVLLALFAFVEIEPTSTLFFFILSITGVQVIMGSILEPVFMGKTFSINIITVLVMLMFWGYIWGIVGLILSIPITVFIKIILDKFPSTKMISSLMAGPTRQVNIHWKKD